MNSAAGPQCDLSARSIARKVLGDNAGIIVDANGNYTYDEALESMRDVSRITVLNGTRSHFRPLNFDGYAALRRVRRSTIATGEALYTASGFQAIA